MDDASEGGKGDSREAESLVVKRHLEKNKNFSFCEMKTEMRKIKAALCASRQSGNSNKCYPPVTPNL